MQVCLLGKEKARLTLACMLYVSFGFEGPRVEGLFGLLLVGSLLWVFFFVCSCVLFGFEGLRIEGFGFLFLFCLFMCILPVYIGVPYAFF